MFPIVDFFSLQEFAHSSLWQDRDPVWAALISLESYLMRFSHKIEIAIPKTSYFEGKSHISIGEGTVIEPGVFIQGPCIIGKNCLIRHGAYLRGSVILGDGCVVGHGSEIKHSILLNGSAAAHFCYVGDSILGSSVNLGAGVKCSNLRLDGREISISRNQTKVKTGMKKLGAIVGDGGQVGCNCVLNPGTVVGKKSAIYPLLNVGGYIPGFSLVKSQPSWEIAPKPEKILKDLVGNPAEIYQR